MFLSNFLLAVLLYQHTYCLCPKHDDTSLHFKIKAESFTNKFKNSSSELTYSMSKTVSLSIINPNKLFKPADKLFTQEQSVYLAINLKF